MKLLLLLAPLLLLQDSGQEESRVYESMILPYASNGVEDWTPSDERPRHVINVTLDGKLIHDGRVLEGELDLAQVLAKITAQMPKAPLFEGGPLAPMGSLLVRADLVGDFAPVLEIMQVGAAQYLGEYHLAVGDIRNPRMGQDGALLPNAGPEHYLPLALPRDAGGEMIEAGTSLALLVRVAGRKLAATRPEARPWSGEPGTRFRWDMSQREVSYRLGSKETQDRTELQKWLFGMRKVLVGLPVKLEVGAGVTAAEALNTFDVLRGLGVRDIHLSRRP